MLAEELFPAPEQERECGCRSSPEQLEAPGGRQVLPPQERVSRELGSHRLAHERWAKAEARWLVIDATAQPVLLLQAGGLPPAWRVAAVWQPVGVLAPSEAERRMVLYQERKSLQE